MRTLPNEAPRRTHSGSDTDEARSVVKPPLVYPVKFARIRAHNALRAQVAARDRIADVRQCVGTLCSPVARTKLEAALEMAEEAAQDDLAQIVVDLAVSTA